MSLNHVEITIIQLNLATLNGNIFFHYSFNHNVKRRAFAFVLVWLFSPAPFRFNWHSCCDFSWNGIRLHVSAYNCVASSKAGDKLILVGRLFVLCGKIKTYTNQVFCQTLFYVIGLVASITTSFIENIGKGNAVKCHSMTHHLIHSHD